MLITGGVTCVAYTFFATDYINVDTPSLNYDVVPVVVIGVFTYFIATLFFSVFTMAVDTLFLCFCKYYLSRLPAVPALPNVVSSGRL